MPGIRGGGGRGGVNISAEKEYNFWCLAYNWNDIDIQLHEISLTVLLIKFLSSITGTKVLYVQLHELT